MRQYETAFLITPNLPEEENEKLISQMAEVVSKKKGTMINVDEWGKRKLAYPIQKFEEAYYVFFLYEGDPAIPVELERRFKQTETIIRYLTIKYEITESAKKRGRAPAKKKRETAGVKEEKIPKRKHAPEEVRTEGLKKELEEKPAEKPLEKLEEKPEEKPMEESKEVQKPEPEEVPEKETKAERDKELKAKSKEKPKSEPIEEQKETKGVEAEVEPKEKPKEKAEDDAKAKREAESKDKAEEKTQEKLPPEDKEKKEK